MGTESYVPPTSNPQLAATTVSSLCELGPRPLIMTGLLRQLLIQHFSNADNIEEPDLKNTLWTAGEATGILIESITRWRPETTGKRPSIILKRGRYRQIRLGLDNRWQGAKRNGQELYSVAWQGSHTLFCIAGDGAETELLSAEVQRELTQFGPLIRRLLRLYRFETVEVGDLAEIEEWKETFVVPVTVGYAYPEDWTITPQRSILQRISLQMLLDV